MMKNWLMLFSVLLLFLVSTRAVLADPPLDTGQVRPPTSGASIPLQPSDATTLTTLRDGGFEAGSPNPFWTEASSNFGSPICSTACNIPPRSGNHFAWFGGTASAVEIASLEQRITIPSSATTLSFWLMLGRSGEGTGQLDILLDGSLLTTFDQTDLAQYSSYKLVSLPISNAANNGQHTLRFEAVTYPTGVTSFFVDDVVIGDTPTAVTLTSVNTFVYRGSLFLILLLTITSIGAISWKR